MGALRAVRWRESVDSRHPQNRRGPGGGKDNVMRDGSGAGRAAERAGFKIGVCPVMVVRMRRHSGHRARAQFQGERRAARRHESDGHIGAKQQQGQQQHAGA